jgi:hypothetical protein
MKKLLMSCAGAFLLIAAGITTADAQMGRGHGGPSGAARMSGGGGPRFIGGGGPRFIAGGGGPRFIAGGGLRRHGAFFGPRRFVRRGFFVGGYPYGFYGGCIRWRLVPTPWGWVHRRVNICRYRYGYPLGYGVY